MSTDVNSYAKNLLNRRGRRTVATILTWLEENIWQYVPEDKQQEARSKILSVVSDFQDLAMDMVASDTGVINDYWVEALDSLHQELKSIRGVVREN